MTESPSIATVLGLPTYAPSSGPTLPSRLKVFAERHPRRVRFIAALAIYLGATWLLTWSSGPFSGSVLPDGGRLDQGASIWGAAWVAHALLHHLNPFHTNLIGYPTGANFGITPLSLTIGGLIAPIVWAAGPLVAINALTCIAFLLSSLSMFLLLERWCRRWSAAMLGGLLFGFSPYMISQAYPGGHSLFLFSPLLPALVWVSDEIVSVQRHRAWKSGVALGIVVTLQGYTSLEILGDLGIVFGVALVIGIIRHPRRARARARHVVVALVVALVIAVPLAAIQLWWAVFAADTISGPTQPVAALQSNRVDLFSPIVPLNHQLLAPAHLARIAAGWVAGSTSENGGYLGITLVLALVVISWSLRRDRIVKIGAGLVLIAFIFSLGDRLTVGGKTTPIPLPEALLPKISLLDNTLPARFSLLVALFAAIVFAVGFDRMLDRPRVRTWSRRRRAITAALALALIAVPLVPDAPLPAQAVTWPTDVLTVFRSIPDGSVVLAYPYPAPYWPEAEEWSALTGLHTKLVGGYANFREPDGSSSVEMPLLLTPTYVEEYLTEHEFGENVFPYAGPPDAQARADLCTFVLGYGIGAVVWWNAGLNASEVSTYFSSVLGAPTVDDGDVRAWLSPAAHCSR